MRGRGRSIIFRIGFQESSYLRGLIECSNLCLCSVERRRKECREIIEGALDAWLERANPEEEFYPWTIFFFYRIAAEGATRSVQRENYPIPMAIRTAAGFHPNSTYILRKRIRCANERFAVKKWRKNGILLFRRSMAIVATGWYSTKPAGRFELPDLLITNQARHIAGINIANFGQHCL